MIRFLISVVLFFGGISASAQNYQLFMRLSDPGGALPGPIASLPGITGSGFYQIGCTEHKFENSGASVTNHSPYLITQPVHAETSPLIRQHLNQGTSFTVEIFFMEVNGGTLTPYFGVRLNNASLSTITVAADESALQETLAFRYNQIIWYDLVNSLNWGWDLVLNQPI